MIKSIKKFSLKFEYCRLCKNQFCLFKIPQIKSASTFHPTNAAFKLKVCRSQPAIKNYMKTNSVIP